MTILVIDAMPVVYQAFATVGHFTTTSGIKTGVRFGFIRMLRSYAAGFKARKVVVCWDTPAPIKKAEGMSSYKSNRDSSSKQDMYAQIPGLQEMLALTFVTQLSAPGHEADDLCATVARGYEEEFGEDSVIVTVDRDLFSAVSSKITVYHTSLGKHKIDEQAVRDNFGIHSHLIPLHKAVLGDKSDNIAPLIKGARADAFKLILERANMEDDPVAILTGFFPPEDDNHIEALLNLRLTKLHKVPKDEWVIQKGKGDAVALKTLFEELEFKSMMTYIDQLTVNNFPTLKQAKLR